MHGGSRQARARALPRLSVRARIVVVVLAIAAAGLAGAGGIAYVVQRGHTVTAIDQAQVDDIGVISDLAAGRRGSTPSTVQALLVAALQQVQPGPHGSVFAATPAQGLLIPGTALPFRLDTSRAFVARVQTESRGTVVVRGSATVGGRHIVYRIVPVAATGDPTRGVFVIGTDIDAELDQLSDAARSYLIVALVALAGIGGIGWFVAGRLLRPIRRLRLIADSASALDLDERVEVRGRDDVSELARTVNRMLDRLQNAFAAQRQLADDVGHELRTPVTIVRGHLEVMDPDDGRAVRDARAVSVDELDRMSLLIDDLTLIARADAPGFIQHGEVRVSELTTSVLIKAQALSRAHTWAGGPPALGLVSGDARRLGQAWLQLAQNAVKYSPAGSKITIGSSVHQDSVQLWVDDEGRGVPGGLHGRVFDRFERAGRGTEVAGSGIGLAIVAAIAESHHGSARLETRPQGGTRALIEIPRTEARKVIVRATYPRR